MSLKAEMRVNHALGSDVMDLYATSYIIQWHFAPPSLRAIQGLGISVLSFRSSGTYDCQFRQIPANRRRQMFLRLLQAGIKSRALASG
jgi:hypothetical protein